MNIPKEVKEHGGYFLCSFRAKNGTNSSRCLVRAHSAREARRNIKKIVGCALTVFLVKAVCP
jgi:hypothetical protein